MTHDAIEQTYCFIHQKWRVYAHSHSDVQRDDIEYAIMQYVNDMNTELYDYLAQGRKEYLTEHLHFAADMQEAENKLEQMMSSSSNK
jgi:hypothetical protein